MRRRRPSRDHDYRDTQRRLAERRVAATIAQSPADLSRISDALNVEELSDETRELVELITEYPAHCKELGPSAVAETVRCSEETIRYLRWLELTPATELDALPTLDESLKLLAPEPPFEVIGALAQWREELKRGIGGQRADSPTTWRHDALYVAACHERAAIEAERAGDRASANDLIEKAAWALAGEAAAQRRSA